MDGKKNAPPETQPSLGHYRYVFVVTYARSGSTLLQSLLNACDGVQIRGENSNVLYNLYRATLAVAATKEFGKHPKTKQVDEPWYGAAAVRPLAFEAGLLNNFVRNILVPDPGMKVLGFKEIRYNNHFIPASQFPAYMDFLLAKFPDARIVFNSRRAEDVAKSAFLANQVSDGVMAWVRELDACFRAYDAGSDRTIHMQYEDYVADHAHIHRMLDFLQLDWTPEQVASVMAKPLTHAKEDQTTGGKPG